MARYGITYTKEHDDIQQLQMPMYTNEREKTRTNYIRISIQTEKSGFSLKMTAYFEIILETVNIRYVLNFK